MAASDLTPLGAESSDEHPEAPLAAAAGGAAQRRPAAWKVVASAAAAAAGIGLLGAGALAWHGGGARLRAAPLGGVISESEAKSQQEDAQKGEEASLGRRPTSLNSVPVTGRTRGLGGRSSAIKIDEDGKINTYYLPGADVVDNGTTVRYRPPYRFYLMKTDTTDYSKAENFYKPILPGKTFTVDMDFHGSNGPSCGCNINFYLVDMPVSFPGKDRDYYCDAQCFPDMGCCREFDMNEGNENVQQITNHACTDNYHQDSSWKCNKWGDPEVKLTPSEFGRGAGNAINGERKFTFSQKFEQHGEDLRVITTMSQGGRVVKKTMESNDQMRDMHRAMQRGMAFVTGYWTAPDMNWMDGQSCGSGTEHCSKEPAYISNWRITSNGDPVPSPSPSPSPNPAPSPPGPEEPMTCGWCESGSCSGCHEEPGWCSASAEHCSKCGPKSKWCPRSRMATLRGEGSEHGGEEGEHRRSQKKAEAQE